MLFDYEKGFLHKEGLLRSSLVDILVKHKEFFKLENQAKKLEKNHANSVKKQIKDIEHQRKKSAFLEANSLESPISSRIRVISAKKRDDKQKSKEMFWFLTEKTNNMVKTEVLKDLNGNEGDIGEIIESQMPKKKEKKEKRLEIALRKRMGFWGMIGKFKDLSQTTSNFSKNP